MQNANHLDGIKGGAVKKGVVVDDELAQVWRHVPRERAWEGMVGKLIDPLIQGILAQLDTWLDGTFAAEGIAALIGPEDRPA